MNRLRLVNPQLAAVAPAHKFNLDLTTATEEALAGLQGGAHSKRLAGVHGAHPARCAPSGWSRCRMAGTAQQGRNAGPAGSGAARLSGDRVATFGRAEVLRYSSDQKTRWSSALVHVDGSMSASEKEGCLNWL